MDRRAFVRRLGAVVLAANIGLRPWRLEGLTECGYIENADTGERLPIYRDRGLSGIVDEADVRATFGDMRLMVPVDFSRGHGIAGSNA